MCEIVTVRAAAELSSIITKARHQLKRRRISLSIQTVFIHRNRYNRHSNLIIVSVRYQLLRPRDDVSVAAAAASHNG